ncbi:hypothetical protein HMPREF9012_1552 [Bacteroidetes bacterium oral taxon 272 str. F0290]|nr:hypothetical protein [Phocaeicola abscessus]EPT33457.1 hypothetical protein HMPREF9012_1552 [Bacteroidetes bacterium oral taxon 272 str. F0290]
MVKAWKEWSAIVADNEKVREREEIELIAGYRDHLNDFKKYVLSAQ